MTAVEAAKTTSDDDTSSMVFIGNLSYQTREAELKELCEKIGKVSISKIIFRGPRSQGYGFVTFEEEGDALKAVETLKDHEFDGRKINVQRAVPKSERSARPAGTRGRGSSQRRPRPTGPPSTTVVYVGNLPYKAVDQDLLNIFEGYKVASAKVIFRHNGMSRGFGFVTLANEAEQKRAIADLAGAECDERPLIIRAAMSEDHSTGADNGDEAKDEE